MRSLRSLSLTLASAGVALFGLAACVQPANPGTSDTLVPLVLAPATSTTAAATVPLGSAAAPPSQTVVLGAGSVSTAPVATTVPVATTLPAGTTVTTLAPTGTATTLAAGTQSYTVAANDTMYSIARRCSMSADALATYNSWTDGASHVIHPRDVIAMPCVPAGGSAATTATTIAKSGSSATTTTSTTGTGVAAATYTVVAGDYLSGIAAKVGTTVKAIVTANGWTDGTTHKIYPGDVIKLPAKK